MGFPILKLPVVALKVLVDQLNDVELVAVSLISKRADWFLEVCGKKSVSFFNLESYKIRSLHQIQILELFLLEINRRGELPRWHFELCCSVGSDQLISISCNTFDVRIYFGALEDIEKFAGVRRNLKIGELLVPVVATREYGAEKIRIFWNTKTNGMIALMDYFKDTFNVPIELLKFTGGDTKAIKRVVNHLNSTQTVVKNVRVDSNIAISEDDFEWILKNVSATEKFSSYLEFGWNFTYNGKIRAKNIYIENGRWFTLRNLLSTNENEKISVHRSDFQRYELREFLRQWKIGKFPILKEVNLATNVSFMDMTSGIKKRLDKCEDTFGRQVVAFRGHGDSYGIVSPTRNNHRYNTGGRGIQAFDVHDIAYPDQSGYGYFCMCVHNG
ncbi:unnamed protein product [Caenorhabditis brenneri]